MPPPTMGWGLGDPHPGVTLFLRSPWGCPPSPPHAGVPHRLELLQPVLHGAPKGWGGAGGSPSSPSAGMGDVTLGPRRSARPPSYIQARWRVALSPVPVAKAGAVPALIPSDGRGEGADGRDAVEPPLHLGHAGTPDPPKAAAGGGPRHPGR